MTDREARAAAALQYALGAEIKAWRQRRGLTREALAGQVGVSATTIGRTERDGPAGADDLWRIADALGIRFSDLVRRAEDAAALSDGSPTVSDAMAAHDEAVSIAGEQEESDTP